MVVQPAHFADLNLDRVVTDLVAQRDEVTLRPLFHSSYRNEAVVRYRQDVFADLEAPCARAPIVAFRDSMRRVRADLGHANQTTFARHRDLVILSAIGRYRGAVDALLGQLWSLPYRSVGLRGLSDYTKCYAASEPFAALSRGATELTAAMSEINYGLLLGQGKVTVRRYASEADYATTVLKRFERFRETRSGPPAPPPIADDCRLNHVEAALLELVARLFPDQFRSLREFVSRQTDFIDGVLEIFDREVEFYLAYLAYIEPLKGAGLPFCLPEVSSTDKETDVHASFDLALAAKLVRRNASVVCNSFGLAGAERMLVVSGPNQGGKTTFARMFGQVHFLAGLGCPVPGRRARVFLSDQIFTHFEREEDIAHLRSKLEDELVRLRGSCDTMTSESLIILNEIFASTSLEDQTLLCTRILGEVLKIDALAVCVTFIDSLSTLSGKTVSMVGAVDPDEPALRTFEVLRRPADGLAYARSLAERRGVTYEKLRTRIRP